MNKKIHYFSLIGFCIILCMHSSTTAQMNFLAAQDAYTIQRIVGLSDVECSVVRGREKAERAYHYIEWATQKYICELWFVVARPELASKPASVAAQDTTNNNATLTLAPSILADELLYGYRAFPNRNDALHTTPSLILPNTLLPSLDNLAYKQYSLRFDGVKTLHR